MRVLTTALTAFALSLTACGGSDSAGPGGQFSLSITITANPIASGTSAQASATITDASGHSSPASGVTWNSSASTVASVNGSGLVTGARIGGAVISATSGGVTGQVTVTVTPGTPTSVTIFSGDLQIGDHNSQMPDPLCVIVKDAAGNVVPGVIATYAVATGGGTLANPTAPATGNTGIAISGLWTLGSAVGQQTVLASVSGVGSVTFKATSR